MCAERSVSHDTDSPQETTEPLPQYADLSDRQLLAIFVDTLIGYDFIGDINDHLTDRPFDEWIELCPGYAQLREALTAAEHRLAADAGAGGGGGAE